jgi:hypothetical protein
MRVGGYSEISRTLPPSNTACRRAIGEYLAHYHGERNHQGLGTVMLMGAPEPANQNG